MKLSAQLTALTFVEFSTEAFLDKMVEAVAQWDEFHLVNHLVDESKLKKELCLTLIDSSLLHIEQSRIV